MINLLGTLSKRELRTARLNVILRRYLFLLGLVGVSVISIFGIGYWLLINEANLFKTESLGYKNQMKKYENVQKEATSFSNNLLIAKTILANEVLFSDLITTIASTLPSGSSLQNLSVSTKEFSKPITLTILTSSYDNALNVKNRFEDSPAFENVNIASIADSEMRYGYTVNLNVNITKDAFINKKENVTQ